MIYFRTDCNKIIASGHLMRCLTIANEFSKRNQDVTFIVSDKESSHLLKNYNYPIIILNSKWDNLDYEIPLLSKYLPQNTNSLFVIDSYYVTNNYVRSLQKFGKVCYLGSKEIYLENINALINYSFNLNNNFYNEHYNKQKTKLLLGPSFIPIREEFTTAPKQVSESIKSIFISTGNTDPQFFTDKILEMLISCTQFENCTIHVVVGSMFNNSFDLINKYDKQNQIIFHKNVQSMSTIMKECDIAIVANGTTVYELMAYGIPSITFAMVQEQLSSAIRLSEMNLTLYTGPSFIQTKTCLEKIKMGILKLMTNYKFRKNLKENAQNIVSGQGCKNIVNELLTLI